jgi:hypothetical protein
MLTILVYLLRQERQVQGRRRKVEELIGSDRLAQFVKTMELCILFEAWMNQDAFTQNELDLVERFNPYFVGTLIDTIQRDEGHGMKILKLHLLSHFPMMIRLFGRPQNVDGMGPESHLKTKVKDRCRETRMQAKDVEIRTAMKDFESMALNMGGSEIVKLNRSSVMMKYCADLKFAAEHETLKRKRNGKRFKIIRDEHAQCHIVAKNAAYRGQTFHSRLLSEEHLCQFLPTLEGVNGYLHSQFNHTNFKVRGDPLDGRHDWAQVHWNGDIILCHFLIFLEVTTCPIPVKMLLDEINIGTYALVHFVDQNVFDSTPSSTLYGTTHRNFHVDENCSLITGWSKHTDAIHEPYLPR